MSTFRCISGCGRAVWVDEDGLCAACGGPTVVAIREKIQTRKTPLSEPVIQSLYQ